MSKINGETLKSFKDKNLLEVNLDGKFTTERRINCSLREGNFLDG